MKWRLIPYSENSAFQNMAIDEAITESVIGGAGPTIRFYGWRPNAISIGYFQSLKKEVDLLKCESNGVEIVRRRTGGGAVYHDQDGEITYSIIAKEELFPKDIISSYKVICEYVINSLSKIGIKSEFKPINDIVVGGKKISGNAQTRRKGVLLQHGTVLYKVDVEEMFSLLKVSDEKIKDKMIDSARQRVTSVKEQNNASKEEMYDALVKGFTQDKEFEFGKLTEKEEETAETLISERYKKKEWNFMR